MQTVSDQAEASGFCKDEFQAWTAYCASRLIMKKIGERAQGDAAFAQLVKQQGAALDNAFKRCVEADTPAQKGDGVWKAAPKVPRSAYKPTTSGWETVGNRQDADRFKLARQPFFATLDRGTAQNFWTVYDKFHLPEPPFPLLQCLRMPPRGHDLHQLVEHAIGVFKSAVQRALDRARRRHRCPTKLTTKQLVEAVKEGIAKFDAVSWDRNFPKLWECLAIVAADRGTVVKLTRKDAAGKVSEVSVLGTGGGYAYVQFS